MLLSFQRFLEGSDSHEARMALMYHWDFRLFKSQFRSTFSLSRGSKWENLRDERTSAREFKRNKSHHAGGESQTMQTRCPRHPDSSFKAGNSKDF